jgi:hypothetical protein
MAPNNDCGGLPSEIRNSSPFHTCSGELRIEGARFLQCVKSLACARRVFLLNNKSPDCCGLPRPPRLPRLLRATGMCWSTEVTLAFVLLEMCCCAIIAAQGLHGLLLAFGPLVLQEVVQLLLWLEIDRHDRAGGGGECSAANTALSFVELALVCGLVPVGFALLAIRSLDEWQAALAAVCRGGLEPRTSIDRPHRDLLLTRVYATPRLHWAGLGFRRAAAPRDRGRRGRGAGGAQARALPPTLSLH